MPREYLALALSIAFGAAPGLAESVHGSGGLEALTQELPLSETAFAQERGELQITFGTTLFDEADDGDRTTTSLGLEYGVGDALQLSIELPYAFVRSGEGNLRGIGDVRMGVLATVVETESSIFSAALEVGLPSGDESDELGEGQLEWEPSLRYASAFGEGQLHLGLAGEFSDGASGLATSAAFVRPVGAFAAVLEFSGSIGNGEKTAFFSPGLVFEGPGGIEAGLGLPLGLTAESADWGISAWLVIEL